MSLKPCVASQGSPYSDMRNGDDQHMHHYCNITRAEKHAEKDTHTSRQKFILKKKKHYSVQFSFIDKASKHNNSHLSVIYTVYLATVGTKNSYLLQPVEGEVMLETMHQPKTLVHFGGM